MKKVVDLWRDLGYCGDTVFGLPQRKSVGLQCDSTQGLHRTQSEI